METSDDGEDGEGEGGDIFLGRSATDAASAVVRRCLLQRSSSAAGTAVVLDALAARARPVTPVFDSSAACATLAEIQYSSLSTQHKPPR